MSIFFNKILRKQVSIEPLVWFRIIFGLLMLVSTIRFWYKGWIHNLYIAPKFYFTYYGFDWIKPLNENGMYFLFGLLIITSIFISLGFLYRISILLFFLSFTYIELIDKTNYLNHYYFISLVSFLMCFLPAHRFFSLDVKLGICTVKQQVSAWCINILKFQIGCVYFFAGVAKINSYWLIDAQPLSNWLKHQSDLSLIGGLMKYTTTAYLFAWGGCLFDLCVPFLLCFKRTRIPAYISIVIFHILTGIMFPIGVFPVVMISLTTLFFAPEIFERIFAKIQPSPMQQIAPKIKIRRFTKEVLIGIYVILQILIPLRYLLYPGNLFWTEQGFRFSWRVMLIEKVGDVTFYVVPENGIGKKMIEPSSYLTSQQIKQMSTQPDMILQFAHHLRNEYANQEIEENGVKIHIGMPSVYAEAYVSLFNSGSQYLIDPSVDLAKESFNLKNRNWITVHE